MSPIASAEYPPIPSQAPLVHEHADAPPSHSTVKSGIGLPDATPELNALSAIELRPEAMGSDTAAMRAPISTALAAAFHWMSAFMKPTPPKRKSIKIGRMIATSTSGPPSSSRARCAKNDNVQRGGFRA